MNSIDGQEIGVVMLYPFWGDLWTDRRHAYANRYDRWIKSGKDVLEMTSLASADITLFPNQWITRTHPGHHTFLQTFDVLDESGLSIG